MTACVLSHSVVGWSRVLGWDMLQGGMLNHSQLFSKNEYVSHGSLRGPIMCGVKNLAGRSMQLCELTEK